MYGRSVDFIIKVQNTASENVFVTGIAPSYPGRDKITLPIVRNVQLVNAGKEEEIKSSFLCELDVKKINFMVHVLLFNAKDHANPIKIEAYSGSLPVHRPGNNWLDFQSLGIYGMLAVLGYFSYIWMCSKCCASGTSGGGKSGREKRKKEKDVSSSQSSLTVDTEWIPKHNIQVSSSRLKQPSSADSENKSSASLSLSEVSSDDEVAVRKRK